MSSKAVFVRRLRGASGYLVAGQAARVALNYATIGLLTRYLSLRELGIYFMLTEVARVGSLFAQAGAAQSAQKFIGRELYVTPGLVPSVFLRMSVLLLVTTAVVVGGGYGLWGLITAHFDSGRGVANFALFGCGMILITTLNSYFSAVFLAIDRMVESLLSMGLIQKALFIAGLIGVVLGPQAHLSIASVLVLWLVTGVASVVVAGWLVHREMRRLHTSGVSQRDAQYATPSYRELFLTALPMGVSSGVATLRNSADVLIAGSILGPVAAGVYGPCRMLANLVLFVLQAVGSVLPAVVAAGWDKLPRHEIEVVCRKAANYGAAAAVPAALVLIIMAGPVLTSGFGAKFAGHEALLRVLVLGPMLSALLGSAGALLQVTGHHKVQMMIALGITVLSLSVMPFIAGIFGLVAMGTYSSVMLAIQNLVLCICAYRLVGVRAYITLSNTRDL